MSLGLVVLTQFSAFKTEITSALGGDSRKRVDNRIYERKGPKLLILLLHLVVLFLRVCWPFDATAAGSLYNNGLMCVR